MFRSRSTRDRRKRTVPTVPGGLSRAGRFWRCCLWLSLWIWSAPVPWLHSHAILRAAGAEQWLAQHIARCHGGDGANVPDGWHLHLHFTCDCRDKTTGQAPDDSSQENEPPTIRLTEPTDLKRPLADGEHLIVGILPVGDVLTPALPEGGARAAGSFLRAYPGSVRPSELLSLWRC